MTEELEEITPEEAKKRRKFGIAFKIALPILFAVLIYDKVFPEECVEQAQVMDIISVEGTLATFKFSNGKTEKISHANLKRGDTYCVAYQRQNKYFN
jgi:hypothetical protein